MNAVMKTVAASPGAPVWRRRAGSPPMFVSPSLGEPECIGVWSGNRIFEDFSVSTRLTADGLHAVRTAVEGYNHVWALGPPAATPATDPRFANPFARTAPCGSDFLQLQGEPGKAAWHLLRSSGSENLDLPEAITPIASADGSKLLYFEMSPIFRTAHPGSDLWIGDLRRQVRVVLDGPVMGACFAPDGDCAYVLVRQGDASSTLIRVDSLGGAVEVVADKLDSPPYPPGFVGLAATRTHVFLPAVGHRPPDDRERMKPTAARFVNVHRLDLATRRLERIVASNTDLHDLAIGGGYLHWMRSTVIKSVVALPIEGGPLRQVAQAGMIPEWSRDGERIAFTLGQMRLADWGIDLDSHVVGVDRDARPATEPTVLVEGSHEDFTASWSPCGRWIAYHSHRAPGPAIPFYDAHGAHDAIFVRAAEDVDAPELEVSENGWEIFQPRWAPDGRTILYSSWDRKGAPGLYALFAVDFDPETGRKGGHRRIPMPQGLACPCWVAWSPDGGAIAIEDACGLGKRALWVIAADGSRGRRLHEYAAHTYGGVDYTPDGTTLIFSALDGDDRMALYSIPAGGGAVKTVARDAHNLMHPVVSPDGRWIACTRVMTTQELWRARLAGVEP
jgi:hypothetical protein